MSFLTGALYGVLVVYLGGWFLGQWSGNFSLLLLVLTVVTFAYWLAERLRFRPAREAAAAAFEQQAEPRRRALLLLAPEEHVRSDHLPGECAQHLAPGAPDHVGQLRQKRWTADHRQRAGAHLLKQRMRRPAPKQRGQEHIGVNDRSHVACAPREQPSPRR